MANNLLFTGLDPNTNDLELFTTDGTQGGTHLLGALNYDPLFYVQNGLSMTTLGSTAYLVMAADSGSGNAIWSYDGSSLTQITSSSNYVYGAQSGYGTPNFEPLAAYGSDLVFSQAALTNDDGGMYDQATLAVYNGTSIVQPATPNGGYDPNNFTTLNGVLYFEATDSTTNARAIYSYNGTSVTEIYNRNPTLTQDFGAGPETIEMAGSVLGGLVAFNGSLYFGSGGNSLYKLTSTASLSNNAVDASNSSSEYTYSNAPAQNLIVYNNSLYFYTGQGGDNETPGVYKISTSGAETQVSNAYVYYPPAVANNTLYFFGEDPQSFQSNLYAVTTSSGTASVVAANVNAGDIPIGLGSTLFFNNDSNTTLGTYAGSVGTLTDGGAGGDPVGVVPFTPTSFGVPQPTVVTVAEFEANKQTLNQNPAGIAIRDLASTIAGDIDSIQDDASHVASIASTDNALPTVGVNKFLRDRTVLDQITGGFAVNAQVPANVTSNLDALAADYAAGHLKAISVASGTVTVSVAQAIGNDKDVLDALGSFAVSDTASAIASNIAALQADASHIAAITSTNGLPGVGVGQFNADQPVLDKITGGFSLAAGNAANVSTSIDAIAADFNAGHIKTITVSSGTVSVSATQAVDDQAALDAIGTYTVSDTAAAIAANIAALQADASHIASITSTNGLPSVGVGQFTADQTVLDKITGGFALAAGNAANVSANIDAIAADFNAGHIKAITVSSGTVTVTAARALNDKAALDAIGNYAVSDTGAAISANINALQTDASHIASLSTTDGAPVSVGVGQATSDRAVLDKVSGGFTVAAQNTTNLASNLDALQSDVDHIAAVTIAGSSPELSISATQASNDAGVIGKITSHYALQVNNADGSATTTANGSGLTIAPRALGLETFVFQPSFGQDTITDLASHLTGTSHDTITLPSAEFANFGAVLADAKATSDGLGSIITAQNGDALTLANVTTTQLQSGGNDFKFA